MKTRNNIIDFEILRQKNFDNISKDLIFLLSNYYNISDDRATAILVEYYNFIKYKFENKGIKK